MVIYHTVDQLLAEHVLMALVAARVAVLDQA
jgi:hypothetical protein